MCMDDFCKEIYPAFKPCPIYMAMPYLHNYLLYCVWVLWGCERIERHINTYCTVYMFKKRHLLYDILFLDTIVFEIQNTYAYAGFSQLLKNHPSGHVTSTPSLTVTEITWKTYLESCCNDKVIGGHL